MDYRTLLMIFGTVFVAEVGDKTQLATMLFSANANVSRWGVFAAASLALVAACGLGVVVGGALNRFISERTLTIGAGVIFVALGLMTLWGALRAQ